MRSTGNNQQSLLPERGTFLHSEGASQPRSGFLFKGKRCSKCKKSKPLSEFYKQPNKKDGLKDWCKSCYRIYVRKYQKTAVGKISLKRYKQSEKGKAVNRKANKKYRKTTKGKTRDKRFIARHPNQIKAKSAVKYAIRVGKLPKPNSLLCHYCPKPAQQYHHWHGYAPEHWLDVIPVCVSCHNKYDRKIA